MQVDEIVIKLLIALWPFVAWGMSVLIFGIWIKIRSWIRHRFLKESI
jgi:hypothetical protein